MNSVQLALISATASRTWRSCSRCQTTDVRFSLTHMWIKRVVQVLAEAGHGAAAPVLKHVHVGPSHVLQGKRERAKTLLGKLSAACDAEQPNTRLLVAKTAVLGFSREVPGNISKKVRKLNVAQSVRPWPQSATTTAQSRATYSRPDLCFVARDQGRLPHDCVTFP